MLPRLSSASAFCHLQLPRSVLAGWRGGSVSSGAAAVRVCVFRGCSGKGVCEDVALLACSHPTVPDASRFTTPGGGMADGCLHMGWRLEGGSWRLALRPMAMG